ncbi:MAG: acyltransferase [Clostridia bacterium]|nr:acyltransferase [Clostridia bacterium]
MLIAKKCRLNVKGSVQLCNFRFGAVKVGFGGSPAIAENAYSRFAVKKNATIVFEGKAGISAGNSICVDKGTLVIGNNFSTNKNCLIACSKGIRIGNDVTLGWNVNVRDNDGHTIVDESTGVESESKEVTIGNHVWLCAYADVLKGTVIPDDSVVAYRSLVTKTFDRPGVLIGGAPAKILKENIRWYY